jgi:predicted TIM-barrel fold metal-dependent hydrolase
MHTFDFGSPARVLFLLFLSLPTACREPQPAEAGRSSQVDPLTGAPAGAKFEFNDCHVHLTNYIQEGLPVRSFLGLMGDKVGRAALFGIPLQQLWSHRVSGDRAPTYYLQADTPLYYYSFTDAAIAMAYLSLGPAERPRFDPMITGFNPSDMYGVDHIRRALTTFPGVFVGIGEFTIHKEFVSSKVAGEVASLRDPALDRILDFAAESGLLVLLHNDIDIPFARPGSRPAYLDPMRELFLRHRGSTIIWAHTGLGRVVQPSKDQAQAIEEILKDPRFSQVYFDISWDEVAKHITTNLEGLENAADLVNRYPDRFLFGTDEVAPATQEAYLKVYHQYAPFWARLTPEASEKVRLTNYVRLFDAARKMVRAWEHANVPDARK